MDRISVRVNENIKRLVLQLRFINLLHRIWKFTASNGGILRYKFSSYVDLLLFGGKFYKLIYCIGIEFINLYV